MESQFQASSSKIVIRRRRTRRHRRNRLVRRVVLLGFLILGAFTFSSIALRTLSPSLFRTSRAPIHAGVDASQNLLLLTQQETMGRAQERKVYPYSVIPGGVKDAQELKAAADSDPVVGSLYAGFDYVNARVVRLVLARTAYVSYRIGNKIYWTHRRITLKKGETVLTDGKITARTRCGNRIEEMPQQATSSSEPPAEKFEEPVPAAGTAMQAPPVPFESALLNRPGVPGLGPAAPGTLYDPFSPGSWVPLNPAPLPGVCGIGKKKKGSGGEEAVATADGKKKKGGDPCGNGGGGGSEVPEPSTWLLLGSGVTLLLWIARRQFARG